MSEHVAELVARARDGELSFTERRTLQAHLATCPRCTVLSGKIERNDAMLATPEPAIAPAPYGHVVQPRSVWGPFLLTAALAMLAGVACSGVFTRSPLTEVASSSDSPGPSALRSPNSTAMPAPSPTPASSVNPPIPFVGEPESVTGINANPLGTLHGDWIFVLKQVPPSSGSPGNYDEQLWAVPLDGGVPRLTLSFQVAPGGSPEALSDNGPYLRRQFSPDGTQIVVSVKGQLVVVDLPRGQARRLGVVGYYPSWSKDGSQIALLSEMPFTRLVPVEDQIGVVPASGGVVRQVAPVHYARTGAEWSPDGTMLIVNEGEDGIAIVNVADAQVVRRLTGRTASEEADQSFAHWRQSGPQIAMTTVRSDDTQVLVLDDATAPERVVAQTSRPHDTPPCHCPTGNLPSDPRWNPALPNELLYSMGGETHETHIVDVQSGKDTKLPVTAVDATWTWDGKQVAYLVQSSNDPRTSGSLRLYDRPSGTDRELLGSSPGPLRAIASLSY